MIFYVSFMNNYTSKHFQIARDEVLSQDLLKLGSLVPCDLTILLILLKAYANGLWAENA